LADRLLGSDLAMARNTKTNSSDRYFMVTGKTRKNMGILLILKIIYQ
jgi:hypothetical protein